MPKAPNPWTEADKLRIFIQIADHATVDWSTLQLPEGRDKKAVTNMIYREKLALGLSTPKRVAAGGTGGEDTAGDQSDTPETPTKPKKVAAPRTPRKKPEPKLDEDGNPIPTPKRVRKKPEPKLDEDGNPIPTPKRKRASPQKKAAVKSEEAVGTDEEEDTNMESPTKKAKADESDETAGNDDEGAISGEAIAQEFGITGEDGDGVAA